MTPRFALIELDQQLNEPAELLVAGRLLARGDVVVVNGNFGLRITRTHETRRNARDFYRHEENWTTGHEPEL